MQELSLEKTPKFSIYVSFIELAFRSLFFVLLFLCQMIFFDFVKVFQYDKVIFVYGTSGLWENNGQCVGTKQEVSLCRSFVGKSYQIYSQSLTIKILFKR